MLVFFFWRTFNSTKWVKYYSGRNFTENSQVIVFSDPLMAVLASGCWYVPWSELWLLSRRKWRSCLCDRGGIRHAQHGQVLRQAAVVGLWVSCMQGETVGETILKQVGVIPILPAWRKAKSRMTSLGWSGKGLTFTFIFKIRKVPVLLIFVPSKNTGLCSETKTWTKWSTLEIIISVSSGPNIALTGPTLSFHCVLQEVFFTRPCPLGYC